MTDAAELVSAKDASEKRLEYEIACSERLGCQRIRSQRMTYASPATKSLLPFSLAMPYCSA